MENISKRLPFVSYKLLKKKRFIKINKQTTVIKTRSRASSILPCLTINTVAIYNGQKYIPILITESIIGYKLGEFSSSKNFISHIKTEKKIQFLKK